MRSRGGVKDMMGCRKNLPLSQETFGLCPSKTAAASNGDHQPLDKPSTRLRKGLGWNCGRMTRVGNRGTFALLLAEEASSVHSLDLLVLTTARRRIRLMYVRTAVVVLERAGAPHGEMDAVRTCLASVCTLDKEIHQFLDTFDGSDGSIGKDAQQALNGRINGAGISSISLYTSLFRRPVAPPFFFSAPGDPVDAEAAGSNVAKILEGPFPFRKSPRMIVRPTRTREGRTRPRRSRQRVERLQEICDLGKVFEKDEAAFA
ncbi:hypothetical protein U1Q18_044806 [Sarracenia purpurea var. burkii]